MKYSLIWLVVVLTGCATAYKPNGPIGNGGFDDVELASNYYRITFRGNEKTSIERASDFALLRGAELLNKKDCRSMQVVKSGAEVRTGSILLPQNQSTIVNTNSFGSMTTTTASTQVYGGGVATLQFPKVSMEVQCSNEAADLSRNIYDISFVIRSIRTKYKIK